MSFWTYPRVILNVYTYEEIPKKHFKKVVKDMLSKAPVITGSEGNAEIVPFHFVEGTCMWVNRRMYSIFDRFQIVISGNLRDRYHENTLKEVNAFIKFIRDYKSEIFITGGKHLFYVDVEVKKIEGYKLKDLMAQKNES